MGVTTERGPEVHLNLNVRGLGVSATIAIQERCERLRREGRTVFRLGLGQSPFPVPEPVVEALRLHASKKEYLPSRGLPELRAAVAEYHARWQGLAVGPDRVLVGPGSKELLFLLQIVYYGDLVIPSPAWVSYAPQARIAGRQVVFLPTRREDGWRLDPADLESFCRSDPARPRVLILNYPSNPTGGTYAESDLREMARIAESYRILVLSDEIYGELHHEGRHVSIARFYPDGTIVSGGLSKWCGAGGWRLGTFLFPERMGWLSDAMAAVASETYTSTSAPIQYAAVRAFQGGMRIERYLWQARRILAELGRAVASRLREAGARVDDPAGAFYLFPDLEPFREALAGRGIRSGAELAERLLAETGVAVLPGVDFGRPPGELSVRLAYVDFDGARALTAAERIPLERALGEEWIRTYAGSVLEAADRFSGWLSAGC